VGKVVYALCQLEPGLCLAAFLVDVKGLEDPPYLGIMFAGACGVAPGLLIQRNGFQDCTKGVFHLAKAVGDQVSRGCKCGRMMREPASIAIESCRARPYQLLQLAI
jgi:hypothetical protein